jgi:hypothetical protein
MSNTTRRRTTTPKRKPKTVMNVTVTTNSRKRKKPEPKPARIILANWLKTWNTHAYETDPMFGWSFFWVDFIDKCLDVTEVEKKDALTLEGVKKLLIRIFEE